MLSKMGLFGERLSKIGCELLKRVSMVESKSKKKKSGQCGHASPSPF